MGLALYGIVMLGIFLGIYGETLLEHHTSSTTEQHTTVRKTVVEAMVQTTQDARNNYSNANNTNATNNTNNTNHSSDVASSSSQSTTNGGTMSAAVSSWGATKPKTKLQTVISGELLQMADDNTQQAVITNNNATTTNNNTTTTSTDNQQVLEQLQKNQQTLLQDIIVLIFDELPILTFVSLIGLAIGQIEGWDLIKRYVLCVFVFFESCTVYSVGMGETGTSHT